MLESAIQLFNNRQKSDQKLQEEVSRESKWPFLQRMQDLKVLNILDIQVAKKFSNGSEVVAAFLCHLFLSTKALHLCIKIVEDEIIPTPEDLWKSAESDQTLSPSDLETLKSMILNGVKFGLETIISEVNERELCFKSSSPVLKCGAFYYFHKSWNLQKFFLESLHALLKNSTPELTVDLEKINVKLSSLESQNKLLKEQSLAIKNGLESTLTVITGGPGTGKTYTAGILIQILYEEIPNLSVSLCAPTGKAAANLEASIARALSTFPSFQGISGQTIHQLLKIGPSGFKEETCVISSDVVIVDECSMIDAEVFGSLLSSIKPGARLIMLGDKNQLPAVEAGSLFADMIDSLKSGGKVVELKKTMRSESEEIIKFLEKIKIGDRKSLDFINLKEIESENSQISFRSIEDLQMHEFQKLLLKKCLPHLKFDPKYKDELLHALLQNANIEQDINFKALLKHFNQFRILTPLKKGFFGSDMINMAISLASQLKNHPLEIIPIMITKNDYRLKLFNGEVGVLLKYLQNDYLETRAIFPSRSYEGPLRLIAAELLPKYELAYCLSVHKSQGSEFDHVILILPSGSEEFGREGFYTGASRAKKRLEVWSSLKVMEGALARTGARLSGVGEASPKGVSAVKMDGNTWTATDGQLHMDNGAYFFNSQ